MPHCPTEVQDTTYLGANVLVARLCAAAFCILLWAPGLTAALLRQPAGDASPGPILGWLLNHDQRAAESDSYLSTDGPSFTRANSTVPTSMVQLETRYNYANSPLVNSFPQMDLRYGLTLRLELCAEWAGVDAGPGLRSAENLEVGFKYLTTNAQGWIPQSALMVEILTPTGYGPNAYRNVTPEVDYIYGWSLTKKLGFGGSTGAIFGQPGRKASSSTTSRRFSIAPVREQVVTFIETYSLFGSGASQGTVLPSLDGGVLWRPAT